MDIIFVFIISEVDTIKRVLLLSFFVIILSACADNNRQNISLNSPMNPTKIPTQTNTIKKSLTSTPISITQLPDSPEEISKWCQIDDFNDYYCPDVKGYSPDNQWFFIDCYDINDCETHNHYVMYNNENNDKSWVITNNEIASLTGTRPFGWYAAGWSENNQLVYLVYEHFCDNLFYCLFVDAQLVIEVDLSSQSSVTLLPQDIELLIDYALAFSQDSKYLAYIELISQELIIRDLDTNQETIVQLNDSENLFGLISWSPNNTKLIMMGSSKKDFSDYSLWVIDRNVKEANQILSEEKKNYYPMAWLDEKTIILFLSMGDMNEPYRYLYNIETEELQVDQSQFQDQD